VMLGEMLQWKNFHDDPTKPPFPWDPDAARWSREYRKTHPNAFPLDKRELLRPERVKLSSTSSKPKPKINVKLGPAGSKSPKPASKSKIKIKPMELLKKKPKIHLK